MKFDYNYLEPEHLEMVYDREVIRIRPKNQKSFGIITMPEPLKEVFEAYEI